MAIPPAVPLPALPVGPPQNVECPRELQNPTRGEREPFDSSDEKDRRSADSAMMHQDAQTEAQYQAHEDALEKVSVATDARFKEDELEPTAPGGARRKRFLCWTLTKKKWLAAVAGSVAAVLLFVLLVLFLAIVPAIVQKYADKVRLSVNYLDIKSLPMDASSTAIDVEMSLHIAFDAAASASISDADATIYYQDKPFAAVTLPAQTFKKGSDGFDLVIRDSAEISDEAVFRSLSRALVADENVTISTRAEVKAHAMGLTYGGLRFDRSFTIKGFNEFKDPKPKINNITLADCTADAYTLVINATLDNASQAGIGGVGALNLSVYHEQDFLGQAISADGTLGLPRGESTMVLEVTIARTATVMTALLKMVTGLLGGGVQFYITGDHPYATQAPLLDEAFAALNISILYTDGLEKVTLNHKCDLLSIITGGR